MDEQERALSMLEHYVGQYVLNARLELEEGNVADAEKSRIELIEKLKGLGNHPPIQGCVDYLALTNWDCIDKMDSFDKKYRELYTPQTDDVSKIASNLFRKPNSD